MKKILIILALVSLSSYAAAVAVKDKHDEFLNSLNLKEKQKIKIEQIKKEYNKKIVEANAQNLLASMRMAQTGNRNCSLSYERQLQKQINILREEEEEEIISVLGWFQKIKYKRYLKSELEQE